MNQLNESCVTQRASLYCPECHEVLTLKVGIVSFEPGKPCSVVWDCESCGQKANGDFVARFKLELHLEGSPAENREALEQLAVSYRSGTLDIKALVGANLKRLESARMLAQIQLERSQKELDAVTDKMTQLGVNPDTIQMEIDKLQAALEAKLTNGSLATGGSN